MEVTGLYSNR